MKYSIFNKLNRDRKGAEMFTTLKPDVQACRQTDNQPSIEHRTAIQIELLELRNLVLDAKTLETHRTPDFSEDQELIPFKSELDQNIRA